MDEVKRSIFGITYKPEDEQILRTEDKKHLA
jgi:hypothetical protein